MINDNTAFRADGRAVAVNPYPNPPPPKKHKHPAPPESSAAFAEGCRACIESEGIIGHIASGYVCEDRKDNIRMSAFLHRDKMIFSANYMTLEATINFCPMCGRKLAPNVIGATCDQGDDSE